MMIFKKSNIERKIIFENHSTGYFPCVQENSRNERIPLLLSAEDIDRIIPKLKIVEKAADQPYHLFVMVVAGCIQTHMKRPAHN